MKMSPRKFATSKTPTKSFEELTYLNIKSWGSWDHWSQFQTRAYIEEGGTEGSGYEHYSSEEEDETAGGDTPEATEEDKSYPKGKKEEEGASHQYSSEEDPWLFC